MPTANQEQRALLANAIRVLVSELNDKICEAAKAGLHVEARADSVMDIANPVRRQEITVRIFQELD